MEVKQCTKVLVWDWNGTEISVLNIEVSINMEVKQYTKVLVSINMEVKQYTKVLVSINMEVKQYTSMGPK